MTSQRGGSLIEQNLSNDRLSIAIKTNRIFLMSSLGLIQMLHLQFIDVDYESDLLDPDWVICDGTHLYDGAF